MVCVINPFVCISARLSRAIQIDHRDFRFRGHDTLGGKREEACDAHHEGHVFIHEKNSANSMNQNTPKATISIAQELCKGCLFCSWVCPQHLFRASEKVNQKGFNPIEYTDEHTCIRCLACAHVCPECAIEVYLE